MKYILSTVLLSLLLSSCTSSVEPWKSIQSTLNIQSWAIQSDTLASTSSSDTETTSSGSDIAKIRTLWMEDNNVVLLENGKKIDALTTKGNIDFKNVENCDTPTPKTAYTILQWNSKIGVVQKKWNSCDAAFETTYHAIRLDGDANLLTEIYKDNASSVEVKNDTLVIKNTLDVVNTEADIMNWLVEISKQELTKQWFKKQGESWIKEISLEEKLIQPQKSEIKTQLIQPQASQNSTSGKYTFQTKNSYNWIIIASIIVKNNTFTWTVEETNWNENNIGSTRGDVWNGIIQLKWNNVATIIYDSETWWCDGSWDVIINSTSIIVSHSIGDTCSIPNGTYKK